MAPGKCLVRRDEHPLSDVYPIANRNTNSYDAFQALVNTTDLDSPYQDAGSTFSTASSRATGRRLRRTRQRLGSYRHDLLVAMRVVNSIEREMMSLEWENWLADENARCDQLGRVLLDGGKAAKPTGKPKKGGQKGAAQPEKQALPPLVASEEKREALARWHREYCGYCRADQARLVGERRAMPGA